VAAEHDFLKIIPVHQIDDIVDMCSDADIGRKQVGSLAKAREGRREYAMTPGGQNLRYSPITPAAMVGTVDENKGSLLGGGSSSRAIASASLMNMGPIGDFSIASCSALAFE
jgi:hypothetical protein